MRYGYSIENEKGKENGAADVLSRILEKEIYALITRIKGDSTTVSYYQSGRDQVAKGRLDASKYREKDDNNWRMGRILLSPTSEL